MLKNRDAIKVTMEKQVLPKVVTLMGPTAAGKTSLAMALVKHNCEIISVDSALIYRGMDIGSAKPSHSELLEAPHRLIDIRDPAQSYSVAEFRQDAIDAIEQVLATGKTPLLVGGTMMYYKALIEGLSPLPAADESIRTQIMAQAEQYGWESLHRELQQVDPISAKRIHPNDPQRLSRAIEVYRVSGRSLTELTQIKSEPLPYEFLQFAIAPKDRKILHAAIAKRFELMLQQGFVDEVRQLRERGDLNLELPSMRCVGYRQCWQYLDGEFDYDEMIAKAVAATRQLAKRQLTWLRGWPELNWLESGSDTNLKTVLRHLTR